jgi:hypothetical protein
MSKSGQGQEGSQAATCMSCLRGGEGLNVTRTHTPLSSQPRSHHSPIPHHQHTQVPAVHVLPTHTHTHIHNHTMAFAHILPAGVRRRHRLSLPGARRLREVEGPARREQVEGNILRNSRLE